MEQFSITFENESDIEMKVSDIEQKLLDMADEAEDASNTQMPKIIVTSAGAESAVEEFLMDALEEVQKKAIDSQPDFDAHI